MKTLLKSAMLALMILIIAPSESSASTTPGNGSAVNIDPAEAQKLMKRLDELKSMDRRNLTRSERREIRREVRSTQQKLDASGGIYVSCGALIIILILLIIIF